MGSIRVVPFYSSLRDPQAMHERVSDYYGELLEMEGMTFFLQGAERFQADAALALVLSGGVEEALLSHAGESDEPLILLAHPRDNGVAAALEVLSFVQAKGGRGLIIQAIGDWKRELGKALTAAVTRTRMGKARIGVIGTRNTEVLEPWRLAEAVRVAWGPKLVYLNPDVLLRAIENADPQAIRQASEDIACRAAEVLEPDQETIKGAARVYVGLKDIVSEYGLDAVTVKCFDLIPKVQNTGCYALARMSEEGIPAACEADVLSAVGMALIHFVTGLPAFMANPCEIWPDEGRVTLAHCMIPRTMACSHTLRSHFETGRGVGIQGMLNPGPATVMRIGGPGLKTMFLAGGQILFSADNPDMCRTQITLRFNQPEMAKTMLRRPLGNHHLLVCGDHTAVFDYYTSLFGPAPQPS